MPKPDRSKLAQIAIGQVGVVEEGGNNRGPRIREYQSATWLTPTDWAWCAAFVCWCVSQWAGEQFDPAAPLFRGLGVSKWRPRTPAAFGLEAWAKERGLLILPEAAAVEPGDLVVYDMSHCGIVVVGAAAGSKSIEAVEGNTGPTGLRESNLGDGVYRKKRPRPMARSFVRLVLA